MTRTVPVSATQVPGNLITSALWNAGPAASNSFLTAPPICVAVQVTQQTIASSTTTATALTLDSTTVDSDSGHSNSVNNSRYVGQVAGWYLIIGTSGWSNASSSGNRQTLIYKNGSQIAAYTSEVSASATATVHGVYQAMALVQLAVTDYVEIYVLQDGGINLGTTPAACSMQVIWLHS